MTGMLTLLVLLAQPVAPASVAPNTAPASVAPITAVPAPVSAAFKPPPVAAAASTAAPETAPPPKGPPPKIEFACAPSPIKVGQELVCTLTALHRQDVSITVTAPPAFATDPAPAAKALPDGSLESTRVLRLRPMEPKAEIKVAGLRVIWREADGGEGRLAVPDREIAIQRITIGEKDPAIRTFEAPGDDADAYWHQHGPVPFRVTNWPLIIGLIALGGALVGILVGLVVRRYLEGRAPAGPPVDPRPAHVIALQALDALSAEASAADMPVEVYYTRLSEIIRAYLEKRYTFTALEMTSDEIRDQIRGMDLGYDARMAVDRFLDETDLVKFAAHRPGSGEADTVMLAARGLIQITREAEEAADGEGWQFDPGGGS